MTSNGDRDYLRSLGFQVGQRGRFSAEMLSALAERDKVETDTQLNSTLEANHIELPKDEPVRESRELSGYTPEGVRVKFISCAKCGMHMKWCKCSLVTAPRIVATTDDPLVRIAANAL